MKRWNKQERMRKNRGTATASSRFLLLTGLLALFISCSTTGCYEDTNVKVVCTFYQTERSTDVTLTGVSVWGLGKDSLLYNNMAVNKVELELNPNASVTRYVFRMTNNYGTFYDTLTFYYTSATWFQSMDCDCMTFNTLDSCTTAGTLFPTLSIVQPKVTNTKTTHVVLKL